MTLYQAGHISAEVLKVYRSCASLDAQDVQVLLAGYGLVNLIAVKTAILTLWARLTAILQA